MNDDKTITPEEIEHLDKLFGEAVKLPINSDEDYRVLGEMFPDDE